MSAPTNVEITLPVEGAPTATDCRGVEFGVTEVTWRTYIYLDRAWLTLTAFGLEADGTASNCTFYPADDHADALPEWMPQPPEWFWAAVADMRTALESREVEASNARQDARYSRRDRTMAARS